MFTLPNGYTVPKGRYRSIGENGNQGTQIVMILLIKWIGNGFAD